MKSKEREFISRLERRYEHLDARINEHDTGMSYDAAERNALNWAIRRLKEADELESRLKTQDSRVQMLEKALEFYAKYDWNLFRLKAISVFSECRALAAEKKDE